MKLNIAILALILFSMMSTHAQTKSTNPPVLFRGKILFERKMNIHKQIDEMAKGGNKAFMDQMKKRVDQYKVDKFVMDFNADESIYQPEVDGISEIKMMWGSAPAERNEVYDNFKNNRTIAKKEIYDKSLLIDDTLIHYNWKIKNEFRTIAGYNCRRAESIIMDSVWVVAFYCDAIIAPGGPESFNGLPGMILGVVLPRLNVTYFATDVQNYVNEAKSISPPEIKSKAKPYSHIGLEDYLKENMKQWGTWVQRVLWYTKI